MKIVCISASFIPSNTANSIQVVKAVHALAEIGHQVTLFVPGANEAAWEEIHMLYGLRQSFEINWIPEILTFKRYDFAFKAVRAGRNLASDLIYTWALQAGVLALRQQIPTLLELHDRVTGRLGPWLFKRFLNANTPHRIITNTHALQRTLVNEFQPDSSAIDIIVAPNGVDLERYQALPSPKEARKQIGLKAGFTAGYTGHFYAGRGLPMMFDLAKAMPEINFLWVGGHPEDVAAWEHRISTEQVTNMTLTGFVDNALLPQYQAACEVLMMPYGTTIAGSGGGDSAAVASPMKMFEYMATGRAILSSDLPVIHEVLDENQAVFCPPGNLSAWIQALTDLQADPIKREKLGDAARNAAETYTWRARAERTLNGFI